MHKDAILEWANMRMGQADDSPMELGYRLHHGRRVAALASELAKHIDLNVNHDILYIGGLLHDLGKSGGQPSAGHAPRGAEMIRAEIAHLFSEEEIAGVCQIVENHVMRPHSKYFEGKEPPIFPSEVLLVQDADILDHNGCTGIWINMFWNAHEQRSPQEVLQLFLQEEADREWLYRLLNYEVSKEEFQARWKTKQRFYTLMAKEEAGELTFL